MAGLNGGARMAATGRARRERTQLRVRVTWSNGSPANDFDRTGELGSLEDSHVRGDPAAAKARSDGRFFFANVAIFLAWE
jgi:hypothetical protein